MFPIAIYLGWRRVPALTILWIFQTLQWFEFTTASLFSLECAVKSHCQITLVAVIKLSMNVCASGIPLTSQYICDVTISFQTHCFLWNEERTAMSPEVESFSPYLCQFVIITTLGHLSCFWHDTSVNTNRMHTDCLQVVYLFQGKTKQNQTKPFRLHF